MTGKNRFTGYERGPDGEWRLKEPKNSDVREQIDQMIEMLQLDQVVELQPTVADAVDSFGP